MTDRPLIAVLGVLVLLAGAAPAWGQNVLTGKYRGDADATLKAPLRPLARAHDFLPLELEIRTADPLEGTILVTMNTGEDAPPLVRPIQVGRGSTHRVSLPVRLAGWASPPRIVIRDRSGKYIRIDAGDLDPAQEEREESGLDSQIPVRTEVSLKTVGFRADALHVAVLGDDPLGWTLLRTTVGEAIETHPSLIGADARDVVVATLLPTEAPPTWYGWSTADIVVWRRPDPEGMTPEQVDALVGFVAAGGTLVVSLDANWAAFERSAFGRMSGLKYRGLVSVPAVGTLAGSERPLDSELMVVDVFGGAVKLAHGDQPLVVEQAVGGGRLLVLPFDVGDEALRGAVDREQFWRRLLGLEQSVDQILHKIDAGNYTEELGLSLVSSQPSIAPRRRPPNDAAVSGWQAQVHEILEQFEGLDPLPVGFLVVFGLLYLAVIGPGDYVLVRRLGKPGLTWLTFPVAALGFSVVAVAVVSLGRTGGSEMGCIEVVDEIPSIGAARGSTWCSLWSSSRDDVTFALGDVPGWVGPSQWDSDEPWLNSVWDDVALRSDGRGMALSLQLAPWSLSRFQSAWVGDGSPGEIVVDDAVVRNNTTIRFTEAWYVGAHLSWALGPLGPGEARPVPRTTGDVWLDPGRTIWTGELHRLTLSAPGVGGVHREIETGGGFVVGWTEPVHPPTATGELELTPETRTFRRVPVTLRGSAGAPGEEAE